MTASDTPLEPRSPARAGASAAGSTVMPVSLLVSSARLLIERHLGLMWVSGEISNFTRAASGHCYFTLKDAGAQVRCVMFRARAQYVDFGCATAAVEVRARLALRAARRLPVERGKRPARRSRQALRAVRALKEQLEAAGCSRRSASGHCPASRARSASSPHRAPPRCATSWPRLPGARRPRAVISTRPPFRAPPPARRSRTRSAGPTAADFDVLLVARGGGSIEDLWAFNEEVVAAAIHASRLPVVSGVGHETDFTICDFVADVRAATPTAAAAAATPDRVALAHRLDQLGTRVRPSAASACSRRARSILTT